MDLSQTVQQMSAFGVVGLTWGINFLPRLATAVGMLVIGYLVARWAESVVRRLLSRGGHLDATFWPAITSVTRYAVLVVIAVAALGQLGVEITSILAVLGAAGIAIGLALQRTLANIAAGVMLLWLRPFRVGDAIETDVVSGTVRELGLVATRIDTVEGVFRFVPNADLWNKPLSNFTRNPTRMADLAINIDYGSDIREARRVLLDLAASDQRAVASPQPEVFVDRLGDSAVMLRFRVWIRTGDFWPTQRALLEGAKRRLDEAGVVIAYPQQIVHRGRDIEERRAA